MGIQKEEKLHYVSLDGGDAEDRGRSEERGDVFRGLLCKKIEKFRAGFEMICLLFFLKHSFVYSVNKRRNFLKTLQ